MEKLSKKNRILMGITLFSMFFGAGNLIFPPLLGAQAGISTVSAMIGFALSAIGLPILGVVAVTKSGGLEKLSSRVHPIFAYFYIMILYLSIGPFLAIPRTASTSFSMAVVPFLEETSKKGMIGRYQLIYSIIFFVAAMLMALKPEKLTEYMGKKLTPCLLSLIILVFLGCLLHPAGEFGAPMAGYKTMAPVKGFLEGYQTMDTLAALNFGMIIAINIREKGIEEEKSIMKETMSAGWIAGIVLLLVYSMLAYVGALSSVKFRGVSDGTETLTSMTSFLFGRVGLVLLALIFVIACLNTCVGLLSCCGKYFQSIMPKLSYHSWVFVFAFVSMILSNIGLKNMLEFSVPVLNALYPVAIVLILLAYLHPWIQRYPAIYPCVISFCGISSVIAALAGKHMNVPLLTGFVERIPLYELGFGWILPSVVGAFVGIGWTVMNEQHQI